MDGSAVMHLATTRSTNCLVIMIPAVSRRRIYVLYGTLKYVLYGTLKCVLQH
jgi:hypothetical protein